MKKKQQALSILWAAVLSLSMILPGCTTKSNGTSSASETGASVTVQNAAGKDVTITAAPQRIIILPIWEAEMVIDMIGTDRIVALSPYIDNPAITACAEKAAAVKSRISGEAESIISLSPDLVLLDTFNDADGSLAASLQGAGIAVLTLSSPVGFDDIRAQLTTISRAVFAQDQGEMIIGEMDQRLNVVTEKMSAVTKPLGVMYYEDYYSADGTSAGMLCAYGKESPFDAIASAAGAVNVCTAANYSAVSKETVVNNWKPDLLVVPGIAYDAIYQAVADDGSAMIAAIQQDSVLASLPAVTNRRVVALTEKYRCSTSQYMAYAVEELAKACYPELF